MNRPTHVAFGYAAGLALLPRLAERHGEHWSLGLTALVALVPGAASRIPDKDLRLRIWRWRLIKHRGFTHSLLFVVLAGAAVQAGVDAFGWAWWLPAAVALGIGAGGIFPDCLTDRGCPLLWPISERRFYVLTITTGKSVELAVRALLVAGIVGYVAVLPVARARGWA